MNEPSGKYFRFLPRFDAAILALRSVEYGSISPDAIRALRVAIARSMASFGIAQPNLFCIFFAKKVDRTAVSAIIHI